MSTKVQPIKSSRNSDKPNVVCRAAKNDLMKYKKFIVVDGYGKPMSYEGGQFCYCTTSYWQDTHFPLTIYSYDEAKRLIKRSKAYRKKHGWSLPGDRYLLVPVS